MIKIREPEIFYFDFNWTKDAHKNWKHEIEFTTKSNEPLAGNKKRDWAIIVTI